MLTWVVILAKHCETQRHPTVKHEQGWMFRNQSSLLSTVPMPTGILRTHWSQVHPHFAVIETLHFITSFFCQDPHTSLVPCQMEETLQSPLPDHCQAQAGFKNT